MSQLFGTKPNQVPTNAHLGGLAYLDPDVALPLAAMPLVSGAPIVERGSNANGHFIRFADGTQICTQTAFTTVSGGSTWTFPSAFSHSPVAFAIERDTSQARFYVAGVPNLLTSTIRAFLHDGTAVAGNANLVAFGRWK